MCGLGVTNAGMHGKVAVASCNVWHMKVSNLWFGWHILLAYMTVLLLHQAMPGT